MVLDIDLSRIRTFWPLLIWLTFCFVVPVVHRLKVQGMRPRLIQCNDCWSHTGRTMDRYVDIVRINTRCLVLALFLCELLSGNFVRARLLCSGVLTISFEKILMFRLFPYRLPWNLSATSFSSRDITFISLSSALGSLFFSLPPEKFCPTFLARQTWRKTRLSCPGLVTLWHPLESILLLLGWHSQVICSWILPQKRNDKSIKCVFPFWQFIAGYQIFTKPYQVTDDLTRAMACRNQVDFLLNKWANKALTNVDRGGDEVWFLSLRSFAFAHFWSSYHNCFPPTLSSCVSQEMWTMSTLPFRKLGHKFLCKPMIAWSKVMISEVESCACTLEDGWLLVQFGLITICLCGSLTLFWYSCLWLIAVWMSHQSQVKRCSSIQTHQYRHSKVIWWKKMAFEGWDNKAGRWERDKGWEKTLQEMRLTGRCVLRKRYLCESRMELT